MFESLIEVLKTDGYGVQGFQNCASLALKKVKEEPEAAAAYLLLHIVAEHFIQQYEGQPLPSIVAEKEFTRFASYASELEEAFLSNDDSKRLKILNQIAVNII